MALYTKSLSLEPVKIVKIVKSTKRKAWSSNAQVYPISIFEGPKDRLFNCYLVNHDSKDKILLIKSTWISILSMDLDILKQTAVTKSNDRIANITCFTTSIDSDTFFIACDMWLIDD